MSLVVLREVGVFGGGERGSEMPPYSGVEVWSGARPGVSGIGFIWGEVRAVLKKVVIVVVGLGGVMLRAFLVVGVLRGRGERRPFAVVDRIIGMKDGFVLMVVDHHAADHTADGVGSHLFLARAELRLLRYYCTACSWQRGLKALRWGRDNRDRGETLGKESRSCVGALLGGHVVRLLSLLGLVWIKSCRLVLLRPSRGWCAEAPKLLGAPLRVTIIIPAPIIQHLNGLPCQRATIAAWGHFSCSSCPSRNGGVMGAGGALLLRSLVIGIRVLAVKLPVQSRRWLRVTVLEGIAGLRVGGRSRRSRRGRVHDLILSGRASTFITDRRSPLGVCPCHWAEAVTGLPRETQVKCVESRVALQEAVDLGLQAVRQEGRLVLR